MPELSFEEWFAEAKMVARENFHCSQEVVDAFDPDNWKRFYVEGETPLHAVLLEV